MTGEQIYEAIGMIDDRHLYKTILERTEPDAQAPVSAHKAGTGRPARKVLIGLAAVLVLLIASFTMAMAVSEEFRGQVRFTIDEELRTLRDGAVPAEEPEVCDGFNGLPWGSPVGKLSESAETEIVREAGPVEGCYGTAYLAFGSDGGLYRGRYVFNESGTLEWAEIVTVLHALRNDLITRYGEPAEITSSESTLSLEELSTAGSGTYMDMWDPVPTSEGNRVDISLALQPNGIIDLTYYCSGMPMPQQAPQQTAAEENYAQVEQMLAELAEVEITDPSQYESAQRSLSEWADDTDRYGVIPLCSSVGEYAATHEMTYSQVLSLLTVKKDFDGAVAEAYDWVLNQLYEYHPAQFVAAAMYCIDQYGDTFIRDYTDYYLTNVKGTLLERESGIQKTVLEDLQAYGEFLKDLQSSDRPAGYSGIPSDTRDLALRFFDSAMPESAIWLTEGASPAYTVDIYGPAENVRLYFDKEGSLIARSSTDARPYERPEVCDGFEGVTWGTAVEDTSEGSETVIVRRGESFAGHSGTAYYTFDKDGYLVRGKYAFNEGGMHEWRDVLKMFFNLKNEVMAKYGDSDSKHGSAVPYSPATVMKTEKQEWEEVWNSVPTSDGRAVAVALRLKPNGVINLEYMALYPNGSVKTEMDRELMPFTDPADIEVYVSQAFDIDHPAEADCNPMTLEDYILGQNAWKFNNNNLRLENFPKAVIKIRDSEGRELSIMDDADALRITESDGTITWASYTDGPVDCVDMIRHLLPWARGEYPG